VKRTHQVVAADGVFEFLLALRSSAQTIYEHDQVHSVLRASGASDTDVTLHELVAERLIFERGDSYGLTSFGIRTCLLLEAINGADLKDVYRHLSRLDSGLRMYELVREGMTRMFLKSLIDRPGIGRLYFCSPWISFDERQANTLSYAVHQFEKRHRRLPEISVITRPEKGTNAAISATAQLLKDRYGATIYLNKSLHTKLYIREPDANGGYLMAIVGSQNLTRSNYIELGIRINSDSSMIGQLISYFFEISNSSREA
jgi:hypothetical protein